VILKSSKIILVILFVFTFNDVKSQCERFTIEMPEWTDTLANNIEFIEKIILEKNVFYSGDIIKFKMTDNEVGLAKVKLIDIFGVEKIDFGVFNLNTEIMEITLDKFNINSGVYFIETTIKNVKKQFKIMLIE